MAPWFEWDPKKAAANLRKHDVSFEEAKTVFGDRHLSVQPDPDHSMPGEQRSVAIGMSSQFRTLVVIHVESGDTVRIISARQATSHERNAYEED